MFNLIVFLIIVAMLTILVTQYVTSDGVVAREDREILLGQQYQP